MKYKTTSKRLSESLNRANMKPQELANASGVSKASISQYINGSHKPSELTAKRLAEILGVNPLWLMGYNALDKRLDFSQNSEYISKFLSLNSNHKYQVYGYIDRLLEEESEVTHRLKRLADSNLLPNIKEYKPDSLIIVISCTPPRVP